MNNSLHEKSISAFEVIFKYAHIQIKKKGLNNIHNAITQKYNSYYNWYCKNTNGSINPGQSVE